MAWDYPEGYPQNREEAIELAMSVKEEDIDYSDIPPLKITKGMKVERVGDKFREIGRRNLEALNRILREHEEMMNARSAASSK